jgi:hypothetical protein
VATASLSLLAVLCWRRPAPRRTCRLSPCCVFGRACRRPSSLVTACVVVSYPLPFLFGLFVVVVVVRSVCLPLIFRYSLSVARLVFVFVLVCPLSAVLACWPMSPPLPPLPGCPQCKLSSASLWGGGGGAQGRLWSKLELSKELQARAELPSTSCPADPPGGPWLRSRTHAAHLWKYSQ